MEYLLKIFPEMKLMGFEFMYDYRIENNLYMCFKAIVRFNLKSSSHDEILAKYRKRHIPENK